MCDIQTVIDRVYKQTKHISRGRRAHYIPELAHVDPKLFAISVCDIDGNMHHVGDYNSKIAIESISKLFSLVAAIKKHGRRAVFKKIGMIGSFLPFNSIVAAALSPSHTINPFLNQGAMATTSLLYDKNPKKFKRKLVDNMSAFAGRKLRVGKAIYTSESETNSMNMALAYFLKASKRLYAPVEPSVDAYTYQCSVMVTSDDLATMAAVLATGGINPKTKKKLLTTRQTSYILNNLIAGGLYEYSDDWIAKTAGVAYAKSGVGGGLLMILPGICGIGIVSPRLGPHGNSVRGLAAGVKLSIALGENQATKYRHKSCTRRRSRRWKRSNNRTRRKK